MDWAQVVAVVAAILGSATVVEYAKGVVKNRGTKLEADAVTEKAQQEREWKAMEEARQRERETFIAIIDRDRNDFAMRLADLERRLAEHQKEVSDCQLKYWQEKLVSERLQITVDNLTERLVRFERNTDATGNVHQDAYQRPVRPPDESKVSGVRDGSDMFSFGTTDESG